MKRKTERQEDRKKETDGKKERKKDLNSNGIARSLEKPKTTLKNKKVGVLTLINFKTYHKATAIKQGYWEENRYKYQ